MTKTTFGVETITTPQGTQARIATLDASPYGTFSVTAGGTLVLYDVPRFVAQRWAERNAYVLREVS